MEGPIQKHQGEIFSLNIDNLDVDELERRLEMAVALTQIDACVANKSCNCTALSSCGQYCN